MEVVKDPANGKCAANVGDCVSVMENKIPPSSILHVSGVWILLKVHNAEIRISK